MCVRRTSIYSMNSKQVESDSLWLMALDSFAIQLTWLNKFLPNPDDWNLLWKSLALLIITLLFSIKRLGYYSYSTDCDSIVDHVYCIIYYSYFYRILLYLLKKILISNFITTGKVPWNQITIKFVGRSCVCLGNIKLVILLVPLVSYDRSV